MTAAQVDRWRRDAARKVCAGSGLPACNPGHLFGTCRVCGRSLVIHDGLPDAIAWAHEGTEVPGLTKARV